MESLYILIPLSALLVLGLIALFAWALHKDQFDDLDVVGEQILQEEAPTFDTDQTRPMTGLEK